MNQPTFRDVEALSAYLDDQLPVKERAALEARLAGDPELRSVLEQLSQSRALLRKLPQRRAPRNFTLTPQKAGVKPPLPRLFPTFRFASVFASLLLMFGLATNSLAPAMQAARMTSGDAFVYGMGGGPEIDLPVGGGVEEARPQSGGGGDPAMEESAPAAAAPAEESAASDATTLQAVEPEQGFKSAPEQADSQPVTPAQIEPPIPPALLGVALAVAVLAGLGAYGLAWASERRWRSKK